MDRLISHRLLLNGTISSRLKAKVIKVLKRQAHGMFRWVALSLESLQQIKFRPDFEQALGKLPTELAGLYEIIHQQILESGPHGRQTATATLKWLLCAQRLMKKHEILAAISIKLQEANLSQLDSDEVSSDEDVNAEDVEDHNQHELVSCDDVVRLCRNLVVLDVEVDVFRFAHQSVQEYLLSLEEYNSTNTHIQATENCIDAYLSTTLLNPFRPAIVEQNSRLKSYSRIYWPVHLKLVQSKMPPELEKKVMQFMLHGTKPSHAYINWTSDISSAYKNYWSLDDVEQPLSWAARYGREAIVKLLLDQGAERESRDDAGRTPLSWAAKNGEEAVVKLLLDQGADREPRDDAGRTPLSLAAARGREAVVKLLLDQGADRESRDGDGRTPLSWAAANPYGEEAVVQLLLEQGADRESRDDAGRTPLSIAAANLHEGKAIVKLL
jgi:ankyrin repeat protein